MDLLQIYHGVHILFVLIYHQILDHGPTLARYAEGLMVLLSRW